MNKGKLITYFAVFLILVNVCFLGLKMFKPHKGKHKGPKQHIIKQLELNNEQIVAYEKLIEEHRQGVMQLEEKIMQYKNVLFQDVLTEQLNQDSILELIAKEQIEIERVHLKHFNELSKICTAEQKPAFESLINEMSHLFMHKKGKKR